uniref:Sulfhydryl oxidase n=1 Tax=Crocodylus porosus TaxID=8502 RepID=A0A7M4EK35_CROPO
MKYGRWYGVDGGGEQMMGGADSSPPLYLPPPAGFDPCPPFPPHTISASSSPAQSCGFGSLPPISPPLAHPPLTPLTEEVHGFFQKNNVMYLALIFEENDSFVGREVILDMQQYENIAVRRVLSSEKKLVEEYNVTTFPSAYLLSSNGSSAIKVQEETRSSYTSFLRDRSGSNKKTLMLKVQNEITPPPSRVPGAESKLYMADLESVLHCSLRVNKAKFPVLKEEQLETLKRYVAVLAQVSTKGDISIFQYLYIMTGWFCKRDAAPQTKIIGLLQKFLGEPPAVLRKKARWMGCQGSKPHYRGYSCSVWVLFHLLTVQASRYGNQQGLDPLEVLQTMRGFMHHFYYCRSCSEHFEGMAKKSMDQVKSRDEAILWLWERHNTVNMRSNEDPKFPKTRWPPSNLCPLCHNNLSESPWNKTEVLSFLQRHYSPTNIENDELTRHRREVDGEAYMKDKDHGLLGDKGEERGWNRTYPGADPEGAVMRFHTRFRPHCGAEGKDLSFQIK